VSLRLELRDYPSVDGSTATLPLSIALARAVTGMGQAEAEAAIEHTKTGPSFEALAYRNADLLLVYEPSGEQLSSAREALQKNGDALLMTPIGRDALVFLVNEDNPVDSLTPEQLAKIYSGEAQNWSEFGGADGEIAAFARNAGSGSQVMMENLVMRGLPMMESPVEKTATGMGALIERIAEYNNGPNAIGYSVYYYFHNMYRLAGVRALGVNGVACEDATIRDGSYPFTQDFYAVIRASEPDDSPARKLYDLICGPEGAALIEFAGYTPTRPAPSPSLSVSPNMSPPPPAPPSGSPSAPSGSSAAAPRNLFPITINSRTGFVDENGALVIQPQYDQYYTVNHDAAAIEEGAYDPYAPRPLYYFASVFKRDDMGLIDYGGNREFVIDMGQRSGATRIRADLIGPGAEVLLTITDPHLNIAAINADGNYIGQLSDGLSYFYQVLIGKDGQRLASQDIGQGPDVRLDLEIYGGDRRILRSTSADSRGESRETCQLADLGGAAVGGEVFDLFWTYHDGEFIFKKDGALRVVDRDGRTTRELPREVDSVIWAEKQGVYIYSAVMRAPVGKPGDYQYGLMDERFRRLTEPLWHEIRKSASKDRLIAVEKADEGAEHVVSMLIDKSGKRLTARDFYSIYETGEAVVTSRGGAAVPTEWYRGETANVLGWFEKTYLLDANGVEVFEDTEALRMQNVFGDLVSLECRVPGADADQYVTGLARIGDGLSELMTDGDGWLLKPAYQYIGSAYGGRYLLAESFNGLVRDPAYAKERYTVFDPDSLKVLFKGDYRTLSFSGYALATGDGIFYAETGTRKGYLNASGEWLYSTTFYDTLSADD
jgi:ABC-type phosphate transport system substrate-binding protein